MAQYDFNKGYIGETKMCMVCCECRFLFYILKKAYPPKVKYESMIKTHPFIFAKLCPKLS